MLCFFLSCCSCFGCCCYFFLQPFELCENGSWNKKGSKDVRQFDETSNQQDERHSEEKRQTIFGSPLPFKNGQRDMPKNVHTHFFCPFVVTTSSSWIAIKGSRVGILLRFEYITSAQILVSGCDESSFALNYGDATHGIYSASAHKLGSACTHRSIIITKQEINFLIVNIKRTEMCRKST